MNSLKQWWDSTPLSFVLLFYVMGPVAVGVSCFQVWDMVHSASVSALQILGTAMIGLPGVFMTWLAYYESATRLLRRALPQRSV